MREFISTLLHIDQHLSAWTQTYGSGLYGILFLIIFCETGLIVTPFLPGDSLLFGLGAISSLSEQGLDFTILSIILVVAAFIGDNVNYSIGRQIGQKILTAPERPWLKKKNIQAAQDFMQRHGSLALVMARFTPFIRTFTPFVAGLGRMDRKKFMLYSLGGAILWTQMFLWLGRLFGQVPVVKKNFSLFVLAVIALSLAPLVIGILRARFGKSKI